MLAQAHYATFHVDSVVFVHLFADSFFLVFAIRAGQWVSILECTLGGLHAFAVVAIHADECTV